MATGPKLEQGVQAHRREEHNNGLHILPGWWCGAWLSKLTGRGQNQPGMAITLRGAATTPYNWQRMTHMRERGGMFRCLSSVCVLHFAEITWSLGKLPYLFLLVASLDKASSNILHAALIWWRLKLQKCIYIEFYIYIWNSTGDPGGAHSRLMPEKEPLYHSMHMHYINLKTPHSWLMPPLVILFLVIFLSGPQRLSRFTYTDQNHHWRYVFPLSMRTKKKNQGTCGSKTRQLYMIQATNYARSRKATEG